MARRDVQWIGQGLMQTLRFSFLVSALCIAMPAMAEDPLPDEGWADESWDEGVFPDDVPAEAAYPHREVLEAFATACSGVEVPAVTHASVLAAGWEKIEPVPDSQIARILSGGAAAVAAENAADPGGPQAEMLPGGVYRKTVSGRELFTIISGVTFGEVASYGCRVYDLAATEGIAGKDLESWAVRAPQGVVTGLPGATKFVWNPGLKPGHMEMEVSFMPPGTVLPPPISDIPLSGLVLTATAMEFFDL